MHVSPLSVDLHWLLQFVFTALVVALGLRHLLRNTASKYFVVDANSDPIESSSSFSSSSSSSSQTSSGIGSMPGVSSGGGCAVCGNPTSKQCSRCKTVKYCSISCQSVHWRKEHKNKCKALKLPSGVNTIQLSPCRGTTLASSSGFCCVQKRVDKILFPYDEFVKFFNWEKPGPQPCGLLNCGNSCFANVVLQCLTNTRPLVAYLMDKGHRRECKRKEWCFLCELQCHLERASYQQPFSPLNILSRLLSIGGNLGYGKQEDAHEFMRFAIDKMQSICLDEHGGEKMIHPKSQETTLIQHIFGGQLQSQVICTQCNQVSNQYENMMDLTVEIQGDATSLEECLDQFTMKEWLHGDNMYKCDRCNDYVKAWKRLTICQAPNILTIALKRFQSGRFGKLNKKITFPENLNLSPYMSEGDHTDKYKLYAVVVHVDMLNASFFGHYICYIKDFLDVWYRIDDCKVMRVELADVLSQGAYMLLYSRMSARATCLKTLEAPKEPEKMDKSAMELEQCCLKMNNIKSTDNMVQANFYTGSQSHACDTTILPNCSVPVKDPTSSPVSRKIQDNTNGRAFCLEISDPAGNAERETSSFVSSPGKTHTVSVSLTNGFHVENSCSEGNAPFSSSTSIDSFASNGDSSDEMQKVRNPIQFLELGHNSEAIKSENHSLNSRWIEFSAVEENGSRVTPNEPCAASKMNGNCNVFAGSDPSYKRHIDCGNSLSSSVVEQSESERRQNQMEDDLEVKNPVNLGIDIPASIILDEMAPGSDLEMNELVDLADGNLYLSDRNGSASCINNDLDQPSSSLEARHTTCSIYVEKNDFNLNENASSSGEERSQSQGSVVNGSSFYASNKQLISRTHNPEVLESRAAH